MKIDANTVAVVTGANRANGIGFALVEELLARGCSSVLGSYHRLEHSKALLDLAERDQRVEAQVLDLTDPDTASEFAKFAHKKYQKIDLLINNAGIGGTRSTSIITAPIEDFEGQLQVHTIGPLRLTQLLWPLLENSMLPVIVNVSSTGGSMSRISRSYLFYGPAKAAQNALSIQMASNLEGRAIVIPIHPGWVVTDMGGSNAPLSPTESARGILDRVEQATEQDSGRFVDYTGKQLDW